MIGAAKPDDLSFLVVEDSPVFASLAASTIRMEYSGARVTKCSTFFEAQAVLGRSPVDVVVCGYGLGDDKTVHDVRPLTAAPMVVLTGRLGGVEPPANASVVEKSAGPLALKDAIEECLRRG